MEMQQCNCSTMPKYCESPDQVRDKHFSGISDVSRRTRVHDTRLADPLAPLRFERILFWKMHGLGNDFIVINATGNHSFWQWIDSSKICSLADRKCGIGFDQLLVLERTDLSLSRCNTSSPSTGRTVHLMYSIFNHDGSEAMQCGNGARCAAMFACLNNLCSYNDTIHLHTKNSGVVIAHIPQQLSHDNNEIEMAGPIFGITWRVEVDMGTPNLTGANVVDEDTFLKALSHFSGTLYVQLLSLHLNDPIDSCQTLHLKCNDKETIKSREDHKSLANIWSQDAVPEKVYHSKSMNNLTTIWLVDMGNPHAIILVDDVMSVPLEQLGQEVQAMDCFPTSVNVEVFAINTPNSVTVRIFERGSGITLACGTGACAVVAAAFARNLVRNEVSVHMPGGTLLVRCYSKKCNLLYEASSPILKANNKQEHSMTTKDVISTTNFYDDKEAFSTQNLMSHKSISSPSYLRYIEKITMVGPASVSFAGHISFDRCSE